jgi:hypothetical protein
MSKMCERTDNTTIYILVLILFNDTQQDAYIKIWDEDDFTDSYSQLSKSAI